MPKFLIPFAFVAIAVVLVLAQSGDTYKVISAEEAYDLMKNDTSVVIIDVRTPAEFASETGHIKHAILLPLQELDQRYGELDKYKGKTILSVCRSGNRSGKSAALLSSKGFSVINMSGGMIKWKELGYPVDSRRILEVQRGE